jgi:hypothetical protein
MCVCVHDANCSNVRQRKHAKRGFSSLLRRGTVNRARSAFQRKTDENADEDDVQQRIFIYYSEGHRTWTFERKVEKNKRNDNVHVLCTYIFNGKMCSKVMHSEKK